MKTIQIGHSPDPDDAFMWYPLADFPNGSGPGGKTYTPCIETHGYRFKHILEDIQSLNERSERAELEITALSIHEYPFVAKDYILTSCGSSMGDGYGPMLVAPEAIELKDFVVPGENVPGLPLPKREPKAPCIAIPGLRTSAWLGLQLHMLNLVQPGSGYRINAEVVPFDQIIPRVKDGSYDAGLIIHEGQLTYAQAGLECLVDLGKWWTETRNLPMPLGGNAIRRDLGDEIPLICRVLLNSISYALEHREESVEYALNYARDMGADLADKFVGMYVNKWTLDYGPRGREAVEQFLTEAAEAKLIPDPGTIEFVEPADA